jgi:TRAP-type mannitol/chloroaromatic compound transport system permease small subunit
MSNWGEILSDIGTALTAIGWVSFPLLFLPFIYLFLHVIPAFKRFCDALIHLTDSFNFVVGEIIKWALPLLVLSIAMSVFALSIFGLSWTKLFESAEYLHASVIMLGAAATLLAGQHVRVDIFQTRMSERAKALVDFIGFYAFLIPVTLIILWDSQSFVSFAWSIFEGSAEADGIRGEFLLKTLIPLFCIMMLGQGLAIALRAAMCLRGQRRPQRPEHTPPLFGDHDTPAI